jgi:geranylgeranyl diphosphate synthase type II
MHPGDAKSILARDGQCVEQFLRQFLASQTAAPARLIEAVSYSLFAGGKRLRPTLVLESAKACSQEDDPAGTETAHAAAGAVELIHNFSLVHDDLPAMDDDDLRRGRPTCHKVFGEAMAVLAGDAMVTLAFELLATRAHEKVAPRLIAELAAASGPVGMIGGQALDMASENQPLDLQQLQHIHHLKTGALLTTSCRMGALAGAADERQLAALTSFGRHLGLAFQIIDDILDITSTAQQLGKATNKDSHRGKNTYPAILGLDASRAQAARQLEAALESLRELGSAADALRCLARFVVERQS